MISDLVQVIDTIPQKKLKRILFLLNDAKAEEQFKQSTTFGPDMVGNTVSSIRTSTSISLDDRYEVAEIIHEGMNNALLEYYTQLGHIHPLFNVYPVPASVNTHSWRENIQILKYKDTQHYGWHHDEGPNPKSNEYFRRISVVTYLQNAEEGGRTIFPHRAYKPKAGQSLIFPSNWCFPHSSEPVRKGVKVVAVTWYHTFLKD